MAIKIVKLSDPQRVWQAEGASIGLSGNRLLAADSTLLESAIKSGTLLTLWEGNEEEITDELIAELSAIHGIPAKAEPATVVELPADVLELQEALKKASKQNDELNAMVKLLESEKSDLKLQLVNSETAVSNLQATIEELKTEAEADDTVVQEEPATKAAVAPTPSGGKRAVNVPALPTAPEAGV